MKLRRYKSITARIRQGIKLLDEKGPSNWRRRVNLRTLDLGVPTGDCGCVLAQVFGNYGEGCRALGITLDNTTEASAASAAFTGFERLVAPGEGWGNREKEYAELTEAWREALQDTGGEG